MKTWLRTSCAVVAVMGGFSLVGGAQTISIKGSDTLGAKLVPQLAEAYRAKHPEAKFEIAAEGSAVAFTALVNGTAQIGMSSRKASAKELAGADAKGIKLQETIACHDMIVVIVNRSNPLKSLTKKQVEKIFTGQVKDWSEIGGMPGPISVYTRNTSSGTYSDWQKMAMNDREYAKGSQKLAGGEQTVEEVAKNKNGISYVGLAYSIKAGIKPMNIDSVQPIAANAKTYAYSRECYYYLSSNAEPAAKAFVAFATGEEGRRLSKMLGFVPD